MLNEKKIRIMTKAALYEKGRGREDLKITAYGDSDYVRFNLLKTIIGATISFIFAVGFFMLCKMDYFMSNVIKFDMLEIGKDFLVVYLIFIGVYAVISIIVYQAKYTAAKRRVRAYNEELEAIEELADDKKIDVRNRRKRS